MTSAEPTGTGSVAPADVLYVSELVRRHTGVVLDASKGYLVSSRLLPLARQQSLDSVAALISQLRARPAGPLHVQAVEALVTTETSFFRDLHPFETLREHILPELIRSRGASSRALTVWCAACSTGQEPYSLSMLLLESFPSLRDWRVELLASDVCQAAVDRARAGLYHQHEVNRGLPARLLARYFAHERTMWRIRDEVRAMWKFFPHNLTQDWSRMLPVDLLLLRNVLIYFDPDTRRRILQRVRTVLRPDGYLLLGGAETSLGSDDGFARVQIGRSVFYRPARG